MTSLYTNELLPTTSEQAIRIFDERYLAGLSATPAPGWAAEFGDTIDIGAPRVTFPIGLLTTKYLETKEATGRFRTMGEESFDLRVVEYDAGYEAKVIDLLSHVYAYRKWAAIPGQFLIAEQRCINRSIATMLEDPTLTNNLSPWDNLPFWSAVHKSNPASATAPTWSNYQSVPKDVLDLSLLEAEVTAMQGVLDENGEKIGVDPNVILVPTAKYQPLTNNLSQALILRTGASTAPQSNPFVGKFKVIHVPELTDVNDWYLVDTNLLKAQGMPAWVAARYRPSADLGLRFFDESSDFFKNTGKIKVGSHLWYGFKLVFPQAIRRIVGA